MHRLRIQIANLPVSHPLFRWARHGFSFALGALFLWLLSLRLAELDASAIARAFGSVGAAQWGLAILATAISFWAIGHYDAAFHRALGTGVARRQARRSGAAAIAISQTIGLGVVTGALARWRLLPGTTMIQATRLTVAVTATFLVGWAVVTAAAIHWLGAPVPWLAPIASAILLVTMALLLASALKIRLPAPLASLRLPGPAQVLRILSLTAIDTCAAALVLHVLLPAGATVGFATFLPCYLLALGAGLLSGTPGGVGPFEVTLLVLLPATPAEPLMAAILAYRAVYYAAPACIAGVALALGGPTALARGPHRYLAKPGSQDIASLLFDERRAEAGLLWQGELGLVGGCDPGGEWMAAETGRALIALGDPLGRRPGLSLPLWHLRATAQDRGLSPSIYKCSARTAAKVRRLGFRVMPVAREAWLGPHDFHLDAPARAGLRRKLRKAAHAGVSRREASPADMGRLQQISEGWIARHGGERGFSMGRFERGYLDRQRIFVAERGQRIVAFVSFHWAAEECCLDLMRHDPDVPDGTMHSLIAEALQCAASEGLQRLSLAAAPLAIHKFLGRSAGHVPLMSWLDHRICDAGLRQFEAAFAPNWQPLYLAAPSHLSLFWHGVEIWWQIHRPAPLASAGESGLAPLWTGTGQI